MADSKAGSGDSAGTGSGGGGGVMATALQDAIKKEAANKQQTAKTTAPAAGAPGADHAPDQKSAAAAAADYDRAEISFSLPASEISRVHSAIPVSAASGVLIHGCIEGANFAIAEPKRWNGGVLIYCHGFRPKGHGLRAELDPSADCYRQLIEAGWIVSATSYRRDGVILTDAISDILNLRAFIATRYGTPLQCILEGQSMGGSIITMCSERYPQLFDGAMGVGAALMQDFGKGVEKDAFLNFKPQVPILYLQNEAELGPIEGKA